MKRCPQCELTKPRSEFSRMPNGEVHGWCKTCRAAHERARRRTPAAKSLHRSRYDGDLAFRAKSLVGAIRKRCRRNNWEFDLDAAWLETRLRAGKCDVTGLPFQFTVVNGRPSPYSPSVDRIVAGGGYTKGNCRVVLQAVNVALSNHGLDVLLTIAEALVRSSYPIGATA